MRTSLRCHLGLFLKTTILKTTETSKKKFLNIFKKIFTKTFLPAVPTRICFLMQQTQSRNIPITNHTAIM